MSKPLLLLAAPSRESRDKAAHLLAAAESLGVPARVIVGDRPQTVETMAGDQEIVLAIACSDALAVSAARLNDRHGCGGLSAALIGQLSDKSTAIPLLSGILGLPLLPQCLPEVPEDIAHWPWSGPVFVKPTRSSGGWSPQPWGYRHFDSKDHFLLWLREAGLDAAFFAEQTRPAVLGPALLQAALDGSRTEGAMLALAPSQTHAVSQGFCYFEEGPGGDGPRWRRAIYQDDLVPDLTACLSRLDRLRALDPAWGRGLLHLQGLRGPDGFHLIDINLRLTTTWDCMAATADPTTHRRLLATLLLDAPFDASLPASAVAVDLVNGDPRRRIAVVQHQPVPPHILPVRLTAEDCGSAVGGFDKAGVMPSFVTLASDMARCIADAERFRAGISITYADDIAS